MNTVTDEMVRKFQAFVLEPGTNGCLLWTGYRNIYGYGTLNCRLDPTRRRPIMAHRIAWFAKHGAIPEGLWVLHRCDNPPCVNVDHLFLGTPRQNSEDMVAKGRQARITGDRSHVAKLTCAMVLEIRRRYITHPETQTAIAAAYGVSGRIISDIVRGRSWMVPEAGQHLVPQCQAICAARGCGPSFKYSAEQFALMLQMIKEGIHRAPAIRDATGLPIAAVYDFMHGRRRMPPLHSLPKRKAVTRHDGEIFPIKGVVDAPH